jgi:hypothetical protein
MAVAIWLLVEPPAARRTTSSSVGVRLSSRARRRPSRAVSASARARQAPAPIAVKIVDASPNASKARVG